MANKKTTKLTLEEAEKLKPMLDKMGLKIEVVYDTKCDLCGKKFTSKNEERLRKRLEKHIDEKCPTAKWMKSASKILEIAGLKNIIYADLMYLQDGKFPKGLERTKSEELEILNNVKNMLDNWGKKGIEDE